MQHTVVLEVGNNSGCPRLVAAAVPLREQHLQVARQHRLQLKTKVTTGEEGENGRAIGLHL